MPALYGRDGVNGIVPDGPEYDIALDHSWVCSYPPCPNDSAHAKPGDCPDCGEPFVEIGADGYEVT